MKDITQGMFKRFPGLEGELNIFDSAKIIGYKKDPGYGYDHIYMFQLLFDDGEYGLCIWNSKTKQFEEEPGTYDDYSMTPEKANKKYGFEHETFKVGDKVKFDDLNKKGFMVKNSGIVKDYNSKSGIVTITTKTGNIEVPDDQVVLNTESKLRKIIQTEIKKQLKESTAFKYIKSITIMDKDEKLE